MPKPRQVTLGAGELVLGKDFKVEVQADPSDQMMQEAAQRCRGSLQGGASLAVPLRFTQPGTSISANSLAIVVHASAAMRIGVDESYTLTITSTGARLEAPTGIGALRGMATLRQLVRHDGERVSLPAVAIKDSPRYQWRGLMIDTARHFMPVDVIQRNLDAMELVKLNVLHLHLSDNEGFRIESKVFPKLQGAGSNGEYYTQEQMRGLIRYAALRGILIVPEFDMPSHSMSWFAGYPELASSPGPFKPGVLTYEGIGPKSTMTELAAAMQQAKVPAMDPTRDSTYQFLDKFIGEMAGIFISPYFHIGADENNGAVWMANPDIVAFMKDHNLADAPALQAYFVGRVQALVEKHGKQVAAWEEAYVPNQFHNAIFEAWVPFKKSDVLGSPLTNGNKALVSLGFYLDVFYPAHFHYLNQALPVKPQAEDSLLGGEAAMWAELEDRFTVESRIWPRAGAVAERLWSPAGELDVDGMYRRLFRLSAVLDREGVHNRSDYDERIKKFAGALPVEPVSTLLDVLAPVKGYRRLMTATFVRAAGGPGDPPVNRVADTVLVDSAVKYQFRDALGAWLKTHDAASEAKLRGCLELWSKNDALLAPYLAQSKELAEVAGHSKSLAALSVVALKAMDHLQKGQALTAAQLAEADAMLKAAQVGDGETEIAVLPEIEALFHGALPPEPSTYPLF
jgi:hexosaminidase